MTVYQLEKNNFSFALDDYPIFDEEYRVILNRVILDYYRFKEIGFDNVAMWNDRLRQRMFNIMTNKYNKLYELKLTEFNPLYNIEMTETFERTNNEKENGKGETSTSASGETSNTSNSESSSSSSSLNVSSTFPSEKVSANDVTVLEYADNAVNTKNETSSNASNSDSGTMKNDSNSNIEQSNEKEQTESYVKTTKGSSAGLPFSKAMLQFKEYVDKFNLDLQVCKELSDLFMNIY